MNGQEDEKGPDLQQVQEPPKNHWRRRHNLQRMLAAYYGFVVFGMSDSSVGVLVPSLEQFYGQDYLIVSLVFLASFSGYLVAAVCSDMAHRRIGRWGISVLGTALQLACYVIAVTAPPFPVYVIGYAISGLGSGLIEAGWNTFLGSLDRTNEVVGILHACYGLGGILCPTIFTAILGTGRKWSVCYAVMIGFSSMSVTASTFGFWGDTRKLYLKEQDEGEFQVQDEGQNEQNQNQNQNQNQSWDRKDQINNPDGNPEGNQTRTVATQSATMTTIRTPLVWMLALVLFLYVGGEVGMGGWITTFMIVVRNGNQFKMGYVTTGFWTGLTVGRVFLGFVTGYFQHEELFVTGYLVSALVFVVLFYVVPSLVVSAISAAFVGMFIGPLFPTIVVVALKKLPKYLHVSGIGFAAALGGAGAALLPFVNGVLSDRFGPKVLGPYALVLFGGMLVAWLCVLKFF